MWYGFDPGGTFGVAKVSASGDYECRISTSFDDTCRYVEADAFGLGVDSILWWSKARGGGRAADEIVRRACVKGGGVGGTVSPINSLQGAMFVPAYLVIAEVRRRIPNLRITEAHPKALLHALDLPVWRPQSGKSIKDEWPEICAYFGINGSPPSSEHERDAIIAAIAAREGFEGRWTRDLAKEKSDFEISLDTFLGGPISYFWPEIHERPNLRR